MNSAQPEEGEVETRWWELDLRSLAVFRVALGVFVLLTLASFWGDTTAFFTDAGVLPRSVLVTSGFADLWLCFHLGTGSWHTQVLLNGLLASFAVGLIAGWRTPWMVAGCWVLLNSLQVRNPFVCDRGDLQLSLMLFWAFFLPLGAKWSADARAGRRPFGQAQGVAPAALVTQFALIYLFAAITKNGVFWLSRGDGLEHSLISPLFATPLSLWLSTLQPEVLHLGNYTVVAGEFFVAFLLFWPGLVGLLRSVAVGLLLAFHVSVGLMFQLGLFPWLAATLALVLLPREMWDGWGLRLSGWLDERLGSARVEESPPRLTPGRDLFLALCLLLAVSSCFTNSRPARKVKLPQAWKSLAEAFRLSQHWELFSPIPPYYGTFRLVAQDEGADEKVLFAGPPTREQPELTPFPSHRWRMVMIASMYNSFEVVRPGVVKVLSTRIGDGLTSRLPLSYSFWVQLPNDAGELQPAVEWKLWRQGLLEGPR